MEITLNGTEVYKLLWWGKKTFTNQTKAQRIEAIEKRGIRVLSYQGRGLEALYELEISNAFWVHLLVPNMHMNDVSKRYLEWLQEKDCLLDTNSGDQLILFHREMADMFAEEFGVEMETARTTIKRVNKALVENDYLYEDDRRKMHRFKRKKNEPWITGNEAVALHLRAKAHWKRFYDRHNAIAERMNHEWESAPYWLIQEEIQEFYFRDLVTELGLEDGVYKATKLIRTNQNFHDDIAWAKRAFLESKDMTFVRNELAVRQAGYREEKAKRDKEIKKSNEEYRALMAMERPSCKEQEALKKQFQKEKRIGYVQRIPSTLEELGIDLDEIIRPD